MVSNLLTSLYILVIRLLSDVGVSEDFSHCIGNKAHTISPVRDEKKEVVNIEPDRESGK